jgi:5-hydroxyisourate hydrolase
MRITARAVDCVYGRSATDVPARLEKAENGDWLTLAEAKTDSDGCITKWGEDKLEPGLYRIVFDSDRYFVSLGLSAIYPEIIAIFRVRNEIDSHQIQVLLSPYSYSTYFGSQY